MFRKNKNIISVTKRPLIHAPAPAPAPVPVPAPAPTSIYKILHDINDDIIIDKLLDEPISIEKYRHLDMNDIERRLTIINNIDNNDCIDLYVINLKYRTDRMDSIKKQFLNNLNIRIIQFEAFHHNDGRIGCAESHLALVNYAKIKNMKYIIVVEDDLLVNPNITLNKFIEVLQTAINNLWCYEIFNGSPTWGEVPWNKVKKYYSPLEDFYYVSSGHKTTLIIYSNNSFDKILKLTPYISKLHIDQYIMYNIYQLCYTDYLCYDIISYSDLTKKMTQSNINVDEQKYKNMKILNRKIYVVLTGGLGNNLYQCAYAYSIATKYNMKYELIQTSKNQHQTIDYNYLNNIPMSSCLPDNAIIIIEEKDNFTSYNKIDLYKSQYFEKDNILLQGYFQNEKYYYDYLPDLCTLFSNNITLTESMENSCFIHVRRGDYVNSRVHYIDLTNYLKKAIDYVKNIYPDVIFRIFSEDINYCKELFGTDNQYVYYDKLNEIETHEYMKICEYGGICSNSTLSLWGVTLNNSPKKLMIFPNKWVNKNYAIDIYPHNSIILEI